VVGFLSDEWRVAGVLGLGVLVLGVGGMALFVPWVWLVFVSNAFRGIGWAALNTGGGTLLAHIAPATRRAEAAGYLSMFQSAAQAISSPLALWIVGLGAANFNPVFLLAAVCGLGGALLARGMREPVQPRGRPLKAPDFRRFASMLDRDVWLPFALQTCLLLSFPALTSFVALYVQRIGLSPASAAWYFLANGLTAVIVRFSLGRWVDRFNRGLTSAVGFAIISVAIVQLTLVSSELQLVAAAVVYAIGYAICISGLTAMAIDMANPHRRGAAMATYSMANQLGAGFGAAISGAIIEAAGYRAMYAATLLPGAVALVGLWLARRRLAGTTS
jgi:MFS family permease